VQKITIKTTKPKEILDITRVVNDLLIKNFYDKGVLMLFCTHTSCGITTANLDPGTDEDILAAYDAMIPKLNYNHPHDPSHVGDHIMSSIIGASLSIPVQSASMVLGSWQKVVLVELNGPKERRIAVTFLPEPKSYASG